MVAQECIQVHPLHELHLLNAGVGQYKDESVDPVHLPGRVNPPEHAPVHLAYLSGSRIIAHYGQG